MTEPHHFADRILRKALRDPRNLRDLVEAAAGDAARGLDFDRAVFDERELTLPDLTRREADVLCRVPWRRRDQERPAVVCVLVEHQSQGDAAMPLRMLLYAALYWDRTWRERTAGERSTLLPVVVPIVFHTGQSHWKAPRSLADLFAPPAPLQAFVPPWPILYWDLAEQSAADLLLSASAWLQSLAVLRAEGEDEGTFRAVLTAAARGLKRSSSFDDRNANLLELILSWAVCRRPRPERGPLLELAERHALPQHRQRIRTMGNKLGQTMEEWAEERAKERYAVGLAEGGAKALRELLRTFLARRFGSVPVELGHRIDAAIDLDKLRACVEKAWDIASPDELDL